MKKTMLVTEALQEIKTIDARIIKLIGKGEYITACVTSDKNVYPGYSKENFTKNAKSSYASIDDLIHYRELLKGAIVMSNATTYIKVFDNDDKMYSIAQVIDMKNSVKYYELLLSNMNKQLLVATNVMADGNKTLEADIKRTLAPYLEKENKKFDPDEYKSIEKTLRSAKEWSLVDPINIENKIKELEDYIDTIKNKVNQKLQISNCKTVIEIEY